MIKAYREAQLWWNYFCRSCIQKCGSKSMAHVANILQGNIGDLASPYCSCQSRCTDGRTKTCSWYQASHWHDGPGVFWASGIWHKSLRITAQHMKVATLPERFTLQTKEGGCLTTSVKLEVFLRRLLPSAFSSWNLAPLAVSELIEAVAVVAAGLTAMLRIFIQCTKSQEVCVIDLTRVSSIWSSDVHSFMNCCRPIQYRLLHRILVLPAN